MLQRMAMSTIESLSSIFCLKRMLQAIQIVDTRRSLLSKRGNCSLASERQERKNLKNPGLIDSTANAKPTRKFYPSSENQSKPMDLAPSSI
jgi:hypothetical protein